MRGLLSLLTIGAILYLAIGLVLFLFQGRMVHLPEVPGRALVATPDQRGLDWRDIEIATDDGVTLHGWHIRHPEPRATLLFFHGNAGNISHRLDSIALFHDLGLEVVIFDYRGYGRSTGRPREAGLHRDARAAADWLVESLGAEPQRTVYFGRSLGGALAASAARHRSPAALILESTFLSAREVARDLYPIYPTGLLTRLQYATADHLAEVDSPLLVVHSRDDEIIPYRHADGLLAAAAGPAEKLTIRGDHNTGFLRSGAHYRDGLDAFLRGVIGPPHLDPPAQVWESESRPGLRDTDTPNLPEGP